MRFRADVRALLVAALFAAAAPCLAADAPTPAEVERALERVKADPALASQRPVRTLRWKAGHREEKPRRHESSGSFQWLADLFSWIAQVSRLLMWIVIAALVGLLALLVAKVIMSQRGARHGIPKFFTPTHVQDLDIRPESLPDDIGAAARALWDGGKQRAALALLYRGLLSRLVHAHRVPIRDSSTEGDCLALAARALDGQRIAYVTRLIRVWQSAIYGGAAVDAATIHELCAGFAANLDPPPDAAQARAAGAMA